MSHLTSGGCEYHYDATGSGPPMFMLHGIIQSGDEWRRAGWVEALSDLRTLILVDLPGHGGSSRPEEQRPYEVDSIARAVLEIADSLGHERFDYMGFSLGGRVGYELGAAAPERLGRFIIAAQHARPPAGEPRLSRLIGLFESGRLRAMERGMGIRSAGGGAPVNDPAAMKRAVEALRDWGGAEHALHRFQMPVLCVSGEDDPAFDRAKESASKIPGAEWRPLPGVDHNGAFYNVASWAKIARRFLSE